MNQKVYILTADDSDYARTVGVFSSRELAKKWAERKLERDRDRYVDRGGPWYSVEIKWKDHEEWSDGGYYAIGVWELNTVEEED